MGNGKIPEVSLTHLKRLTDDTGILQHSKIIIPDRENGYSADDNARAVIVMVKYYSHHKNAEALELLDTYLAFIIHSQDEDGLIRNFMNYQRKWVRNEQMSDAFGRVIWAFGSVIAQPPSKAYIVTAKECFDKSVKHFGKQSARGTAYSILGMDGYLKEFSDSGEIKEKIESAAEKLADLYQGNNSSDWQWFEDTLTHDNAILPLALFTAGSILDKIYLKIAETTCRFLISQTFNGSHFSFVGNKGWFKRGRKKAQFDQQPIEVTSTCLMLKAAFEATGNEEYRELANKAFGWFLGENDLSIPLYDSQTGGCCDGLGDGGVNENEGAESIISFLLSRLTLAEEK